jgi:hypothetical protein
MEFDPTQVRLSENFLLSDFLGNHTAYTMGRSNILAPDDPQLPIKMANAKALCRNFLEPFLEQAGPLSISYGYITPQMSDEIVHYQDPRKPSHHQWNLGAACDFISHEWVNYEPDDDGLISSPIALAHEIDGAGYPYSRLITYSESPYICLAVSATEVQADRPRKAFYENRYVGKKEPHYKSMATETARATSLADLKKNGLPHGWRGAGYPTHHGGGRRQMHHIRVSKYTMLSDWLFDLQSISNGAKNIPNIASQTVMDSFYKAGDLYDDILQICGISRMSIVAGFVSRSNPYFIKENDWTAGQGFFKLVPPASFTADDIFASMAARAMLDPSPVWDGAYIEVADGQVIVHFQLQE